MGSPSVASERIQSGAHLRTAGRELARYCDVSEFCATLWYVKIFFFWKCGIMKVDDWYISAMRLEEVTECNHFRCPCSHIYVVKVAVWNSKIPIFCTGIMTFPR